MPGRSTSTASGSIPVTGRCSSPLTPACGGSRPTPARPSAWATAARTRWGSPSPAPTTFSAPVTLDLREAQERGLPSQLGLIESRDAGRTWEPISLLGEADFHVLRFGGDRVYGYDASNDRLLVSDDEGRSWDEIDRPAPIIDLVVRPGDSRHVLATTEAGLYESRDGGGTWDRVGEHVGLLAWPSPELLHLVDGRGDVHASSDAGRSWRARGSIGGLPAALLGRSASELYAALHDGTVKQSVDGGRRWTIRSSP
ncbi:MAG: hypothetical protein WD249_12665 [Gaiellaceae bacterium]